MLTKLQTERRKRAVTELQAHALQHDSRAVVDRLLVGLTQLRNLLMVRAHDDVQRKYGTDSMLGTSVAQMQKRVQGAKAEIEAYSCIVVDDQVSLSGYLDDQDTWFLDWLFRLRLGSGYKSVFDKRVSYYESQTVEDRRLKFVSVLQRTLPESARAPLVLFRLFPRAVRIVATVAFNDPSSARTLRDEQISLLPAISECHECHGRLLDYDDICRCCGNPLWNFTWLQSD